jgi:hypothetical protein
MTAAKLSEAERDAWPALPYFAWQETCTTLHLWTQIVGKIRLSLTPWLNHFWHVALPAMPEIAPTPRSNPGFALSFPSILKFIRAATEGELRCGILFHAGFSLNFLGLFGSCSAAVAAR